MKMQFPWRLAMVACAVFAASQAAAEPFQVKLTVEEPAGIDRPGEPASGGIPLPAGMFRKDQPFALVADGKEVPVQVVPLVVDEKGFLRWVLVDLQADFKANATAAFTLKAVRPTAAAPAPLKVTQTADGVTIDTGAARMTISATRPFGLFDSVTAGGKPVMTGGQIAYIDGLDGKRYTADKPASVVVEYAGPLRATVCVKGSFVGDEANRLGYIARITAWAGRSDVLVKYSLANSNADCYTYRQIKESSIELKLAGAATGAKVGLAAPRDFQGGSVAVEQGLRNAVPGATRVLVDGKAVWSSQPDSPADVRDRAPAATPEGWIVAGGPGVAVTDLYFADDPARRLAVDKDRLVLAGVIERFRGEESDRLEAQCQELLARKIAKPGGSDDEARNKDLDRQIEKLRKDIVALGLPYEARRRWLFDCSHLTSHYVIDFAAAPEATSRNARAARRRLHVLAPPAWYFAGTESLAVGRFGTQADELACYDAWGWKYDPKQVPTAPALNLPRCVAGEDNHYETEDDSTDALVLMYLRTGKRAFFDTCESWTNYNLDLQCWRTDGWRFKDGGVWWTAGGPLGSRPQRAADPVTGIFNNAPPYWTTGLKTKVRSFNYGEARDLAWLANSKMCYCHNWGEGTAEWFCITGDRDAYEAAIDCVEQNYDAQRRAFQKTPGKPADYSRDFTRACYLTNATRLIAPTDSLVVEASDYLAACFLKRPDKEPRGFVNGPHEGPLTLKEVEKHVGPQGIAQMRKLGVTLDEKTGLLSDPASGAKWRPLVEPHTWMFPPLSRAMETYHRITGDEDAQDWLVAYGQAAASVLFQPKHGNLSYGRMIVDFPRKGTAKDYASWVVPDDAVNGEGVAINGYLAQFYPDVCARAYDASGEAMLRQRAYDYWYWGSHRGYNATKMHNLGGVGQWVNVYGVHSEFVCFTGRTFYDHAHPRSDVQPPAAVTDLGVTVRDGKATVSFTAPADAAGKVVRYQVKCAERRIVDYAAFLAAWSGNQDAQCCNWWMAANLPGEPVPGKPGQKVRFELAGLPADARYFAVVSFDDSSNRSALSNVAETVRSQE